MKAPSAVFTTPDAAAQSAYFENIRSFLIAIEELGLPTFEPSDLEPVNVMHKVYKLYFR